ncbi:MAG: aminoglycoside phosphotransferase family protein [Lachnospiraceae bacterium]|nr:aminoglycoside phosphotransferase family protein [Lachnospiraceae bacterium]
MSTNMTKMEQNSIFQLFYDSKPISFETINTSLGDSDFREVVIAKTASDETYIIKLADNDFTFPDKINMWRRTVKEYRRLGYYCPAIIPDKTGNFPSVQYKGHNCVAYAEEYAPYIPVEQRNSDTSDHSNVSTSEYEEEVWIMTARIAAKYFDYTSYPSAYCLFETFCPSDKTDEVLEDALSWKEYAETLPDEFSEQVQRIWMLWTENRKALEPIYKTLPTSVFQADLNPSNILIDETGKFVGVYDFNLCGKDVFLNYLFREIFDSDFKQELDRIIKTLQIVSKYYHFSETEKNSALMCRESPNTTRFWRR